MNVTIKEIYLQGKGIVLNVQSSTNSKLDRSILTKIVVLVC